MTSALPEAPSLSAPASSGVVREPFVTRSFLLLMSGQLLQSIGYSTLPLVPLFLAWLGATRLEIGLAMAVGSLGGLCLRPAVGVALDRIGRRPTLLLGTMLVGLATMMLGVIEGPGLWLYVDRVVFGIGVGCLFTGYFTFAADIVPASRRTEGLALFGIAGLFPLCVNPIATELGLTGAELRWLFPAVGVCILLSMFSLWWIEEPRRPAAPAAEPGVAPSPSGVRELLSPQLWPVWTATLAFSGVVAVFFSYATLAAESRGVPRATWMWFTYAAGAIGVRLFGSRLPDRVGPSNLVAPALACYVMALILVAAAQTFNGLLVVGALAGVGHGYCFPVLMAQVVTRSPVAVRGRALSVFTGLWDVALLVLTPCFGWVGDTWGDAVMFSLAAMCAVGVLLVWSGLEHRWGGSAKIVAR